MEKLTNKEEQIMQVLWELEKAFVNDIRAQLPDPKPHYNTISTVIKRLKNKGYVGFEAFGPTHRYYPTVSKAAYTSTFIGEVLDCLLYTSPSPRDATLSRMPSSA